jgi:hypothetical protein
LKKKKRDEIEDDWKSGKSAARLDERAWPKILSPASAQLSLWRRPSFGARRWHGWLANGAQEVIESFWSLRTRQDADEFAVRFGAAGAAQDVDSENAAQQLRPQHAGSSPMRGIGVVGRIFGWVRARMMRFEGFVVDNKTWREGTGVRAQFRVGCKEAVVPNGVKSWRRNQRGEAAQKCDGR